MRIERGAAVLLTHEHIEDTREHKLHMLVCLVFLIGAVGVAMGSAKPTLQLGFCFIAGILAFGVWVRLRWIVKPRCYSLSITENELTWNAAGKGDTIPWEAIRVLIFTTGKEPFLHLQLVDGDHRYIASACLPTETAELLTVLHDQVLPHHPAIRFKELRS
jgi:hypothetical protein